MATPTRIIFSVPKPPTRHATRENPDAALVWIRKRLDELISHYKDQPVGVGKVLDRPAYIVIYSTIRDYLTARPGADLGGKLYLDLVHAIKDYCKGAHTGLFQQRPDTDSGNTAVLEIYNKEWTRFYALAKVVAHLYNHLHKHWVMRELDEGKQGIYGILDLQMKIWRDQTAMAMLRTEHNPDLGQEIQISILDVATKVRENDELISRELTDQYTSDSLDQTFDSFNALGFKVIGTWRASDQNLGRAFRGVKEVVLPSGLKATHLHNGDIIEPSGRCGKSMIVCM